MTIGILGIGFVCVSVLGILISMRPPETEGGLFQEGLLVHQEEIDILGVKIIAHIFYKAEPADPTAGTQDYIKIYDVMLERSWATNRDLETALLYELKFIEKI